MSSLDEAGDRLASLQMNAELRHAQLEMLSAQCATDRIRLRYSLEDVAQHAQRHTLRKAWTSASALYEYYRAVAGRVLDLDGTERSGAPSVNEAKLEEAVARAADSLRAQRELFRATGLPLERRRRQAMRPFFSDAVLDQVRIVSLEGKRVPNPPFYIEARAAGIKDFPDVSHLASLTFEDVLIFTGAIADRNLFHALVRVVQFQVLGPERYAELFLRGLLRTRTHASVPLQAHAFLLESEFAGNPAQPFSVEERVRLWSNQSRY